MPQISIIGIPVTATTAGDLLGIDTQSGTTIESVQVIPGTNTTVTRGPGTLAINATGGGSSVTLTTTGTSGAATLTGGTLNIPVYAGAVSSVTTTGTSGAASLTSGVLNIPTYQAGITLTTTGSSGAATLSGGSLNIPQYSGGSGSGTVNTATAGQIAVYPANGTAVSGTNAPVVPTVVATYGSTTNFDLSLSNNQQVTLAGNPTLTLTNPTVGQRFTINLIQDGTGSRTVTWFSGITWAGGSAPTLQTAPGAIDTISFWCVSAGVYQGYPASAPVPGASTQLIYNNGTTLAGAAGAVIDGNSSFNLGTAISDPATPTAGAIWRSTATGGPKIVRASGQAGAIPHNAFSCLSCTAVTAATETSMLASPTGVQTGGSLTFPANSLKAGNMIRWVLTGKYTSVGTTNTGWSRFFLGSSVVLTNNSASGPVFTVAQSTAMPVLTQWGWLKILSVGASGTCTGSFAAAAVNPGGSTLSIQSVTGTASASCAATTTFDSTVSNLFDARWTWSTTGMSIQVLSFDLWVEG